MKTFLTYVKRVLVQTCICFTCLTLFLFLIGSAVPAFGNAIAVNSILTVFLFSLLLACANLLLMVPRIKIGWRVLMHYLASLFAFYGVFILLAMKLTAPRSILSGLLAFSLLYAICMAIYLFLFYSVIENTKKRDKAYKSIYK